MRPHEELWFEDGNVILIAEATSFRVHKSILARHSEFFHDMFRLPQPAHIAGDMIAADAQCPAVDTSESAEDLAHFLSAIYNSIMFVVSCIPLSSNPSQFALPHKHPLASNSYSPPDIFEKMSSFLTPRSVLSYVFRRNSPPNPSVHSPSDVCKPLFHADLPTGKP